MDDLQGLARTIYALRLDLLWELLLAAVLGGLIGLDREINGKPAGLRTNILICVGAALLSDLSIRFDDFAPPGALRGDPARLVAQVVSGIGFLGAGTILQARGSVIGLTTAATLWVVAAIGIAAGSGHYVSAIGATALVLMTLVPLGWIEDILRRRRRQRHLRLMIDRSPDALEVLERLLADHGLNPRGFTVQHEGDRLAVDMDVQGPEKRFHELRKTLLDRPDMQVFGVD